MKSWFLYLKRLLHSLSKLPVAVCYLYRGVKEDSHASYPQDSAFVWWGFSFCTTTIDVLSQKQFLVTEGPRTISSIESYSGKDICKHSMISTANEMLLPAARYFKVISSLSSDGGLHKIEIGEIEPSFPLIESVIDKKIYS